MESILGAMEALAGEPPAKKSSHTGELLTILCSAVNSCVDSLTFSSIQRTLSIISLLSNSTSNTDQLAVVNTASDVLACFTRQRLPNETPTTFLSSSFSSYATRVTGELMGNLIVDLGNSASVVMPLGWLNNTSASNTDIMDIYARAYLLSANASWVVELALQHVGSYAGYNVALSPPVDVVLPKLAASINITIPTVTTSSSLECVVMREGKWTQDCQILEIRNNSVVVMSFYLAPISVRAIPTPPPTPGTPDQTSSPQKTLDSPSDCQINLAPLSIACALFL